VRSIANDIGQSPRELSIGGKVMKVVNSCPICKYEQCEEIYRTKVQYPGSDLQSNLLNIDYIRNYVLFDKILHTKEPIEACFQICRNCGFIFFSPRPAESDMAKKYSFVNELGDTRQRDEFIYHGSHIPH
jgi:hypothetical protein